MIYIYVLELEDGKYYVGKAKKPRQRFNRHKKGASHWTVEHKPISMIETFESTSDFDEEMTTYKYMAKYGIENVRGGSWCKVVMTDTEKMILRRIIYSCSDRCYVCGKTDHFSNRCPDKIEMIYEKIVEIRTLRSYIPRFLAVFGLF